MPPLPPSLRPTPFVAPVATGSFRDPRRFVLLVVAAIAFLGCFIGQKSISPLGVANLTLLTVAQAAEAIWEHAHSPQARLELLLGTEWAARGAGLLEWLLEAVPRRVGPEAAAHQAPTGRKWGKATLPCKRPPGRHIGTSLAAFPLLPAGPLSSKARSLAAAEKDVPPANAMLVSNLLPVLPLAGAAYLLGEREHFVSPSDRWS